MFKTTARSTSVLSSQGVPKFILPQISQTTKLTKENSQDHIPTDILKDISLLEHDSKSSNESLTGQIEILNEKVERLENEIKEQKKLISELENSLPTNKKNSKQRSLTPEEAENFIQKEPILLKAFVGDQLYSQFSRLILDANEEAQHTFLNNSLSQLSRMTRCISIYKELVPSIHSDSFKNEFIKKTEEFFDSSMVYLFRMDKKTALFYCELNDQMTVKLTDNKVLLLKAIKDGKPLVIDNPESEPLYSPSFDPLFNPYKKQILLIPIGVQYVLYIVYTSHNFMAFNDIDVNVSKFYALLVRPLLDENFSYKETQRKIEIQSTKRNYDNELLKMDTFEKLLLFLEKTPLSDSTIFIVNNEKELSYFELENGQLFERIVDMQGIEKEAYYSRTEIVNQNGQGTYPLFDKDNKIFAMFTTYSISEEINKKSFCANLTLIIPICLYHYKQIVMDNAMKTVSMLPNELLKFNTEIVGKYGFYLFFAKIIEEIIDCHYVSIFKGDEHIIALKDFEEFNQRSIIEISELKKEEKIIANDPSRIENLVSTINLNSLISVYNDNFLIIAMNSKAKIAKFHPLQADALFALSVFPKYHERLVSLHHDSETEDDTLRIIQTSIDIIKKVAETKNSFQNALIEITKIFDYHHYLAFKDEKLEITSSQGTEIIIDFTKITEEIQTFTIEDFDIKVPCLMQMKNIITFKFDNWVIFFFGNSEIPSFCIPILTTLKPFLITMLSHVDEEQQKQLLIKNNEKSVDEENQNQMKHFQSPVQKNRVINFSKLIENYDINLLEFDEDQLLNMVLIIFEKMNCFFYLKTTKEKFTPFILKIKQTYKTLPYHNWLHAVEVLQFLYFLLIQTNMKKEFNREQTFCLLLSALTHDSYHNGLSSYYNFKANTRISVLFGENSSVELYSYSKIVDLLTEEKEIYNIVNTPTFWTFMKSLFIATDVNMCKETIDEYKANKNDLEQIGKLLLACANLSNVARPTEYALEMSERIYKENINERKRSEPNFARQIEASSFEMSREFYAKYIVHYYRELYDKFPNLQILKDSIESNVFEERINI